MNCHEIQTLLNDPDAELNAEVRRHLDSCDLCRYYQSDKLLLRTLRGWHVEELADRQVNRLIRRGVSHHRASPRFGIAGQGLAAAALLLTGVFMGFILADARFQSQPSNTVTSAVPSAPVKEVHLVIQSPEEMQDATIHISLGDNLAIDGYPGTRELSWQTSLVKGSNLLTLPLVMPESERSYLELSYSDGRTVHRKRVEFSVPEPQKQPSEA